MRASRQAGDQRLSLDEASEPEVSEVEVGEEASNVAAISSSTFGRAVKTLKDHEKIFRPPPISEEVTLEERLLSMDAKLDNLSKQMAEALYGIRCSQVARRSRPRSRAVSARPVARPDRALLEQPEGHSNRSSVGSSHDEVASNASQALRMAEAFGTFDPQSSSNSAAFRNLLPLRRSSPRPSREAAQSPTVDRATDASGAALAEDQGEEEFPPKSPSLQVITKEKSKDSVLSREKSKESVTTWISKRQRTQGSVSLTVWHLLDNPESSAAAGLYNKVQPLVILMSVALSLAHGIFPEFLSGVRMVITEIIIDSLFLIEIVARFYACPNRWMFFFSIYNIIDILSVLPLILRIWQIADEGIKGDSRSFEYVVLIGFVPALRLLKTWRRFLQIHLLTKAFQLAFQALPVMLFIYVVVWLFFTAMIFVAEDKDNIRTLGEAMWLTFCSMTSSMFGDTYPRSVWGKLIISALVLISTLYMAIPIGIIGTCFSEVWGDRDRILLVERMRSVFKQNGFIATDIPDLFTHFDSDCNGLLSVEEFRNMAEVLKLGLSEERLLALFQMFDDDGSGGIDDHEFCKIVFPEAYPLLYGDHAERNSQGSYPLRSAGRRFSMSSMQALLPSFHLPSAP